MSFKKSRNQEIEDLLLKENKRLKRENRVLTASLEELQRYKDEYKNLIDELNRLKTEYVNKMKLFNEIESEYKKELDKLKKK